MGIAFLSTDINQHEDGWRQLLPAGHFRAKDGRPFDVDTGWYIDEAIAQRLIAKVALNRQDLMLDYEHQSLRADDNGQPVPASGWFDQSELKWVDGKGLYIRPRWTDKARAMLDAKEYRYLSAVFHYDKNGHPTELISAALTNDPALTGMDELTKVAALKVAYLSTDSQSTGDDSMNEYLLQLLAALNIEVTEEDYEAAVAMALTKIAELQSKDEQVADLTRRLTTNKPDPLSFVPRAQFEELGKQVAALKAQQNSNGVASVIDQARRKGQVVAAEVENLTDIGSKHGVAVLKQMLSTRPAIAALTDAEQIIDEAIGAVKRILTEEERAVMESMGLDEEAFLAYLIEQEKNKEAE